MKDARKIIVLMFALTICAIMVAIISSWIYYGSAKPESVNILGHLMWCNEFNLWKKPTLEHKIRL